MNAAGFVPYDVCGQFRRETDAALCQIDIMFVRRESALRAKKIFWNRDPAGRPQAQRGAGVEGDERRDRVEQQVHHRRHVREQDLLRGAGHVASVDQVR